MIQENFDKAVAFHGHSCPGLAIGVRAATELVKLWDVARAQDEEITCVTENDACGVDALCALLGCTLGKGNLVYRGRGKQAFSFYDRKNGRSVRFVLKPFEDDLSRDARQQMILTAPLEDVFIVGETRLPCPERARLFGSAPCSVCGETTGEQWLRLQEGKPVCLDCAKTYDRGW